MVELFELNDEELNVLIEGDDYNLASNAKNWKEIKNGLNEFCGVIIDEVYEEKQFVSVSNKTMVTVCSGIAIYKNVEGESIKFKITCKCYDDIQLLEWENIDN